MKLILDSIEIIFHPKARWRELEDDEIHIEAVDINYQQVMFLKALFKGDDEIFNNLGTNDPSCQYSLDIIFEDRAFKHFRWVAMETDPTRFWVSGYCGDY